MKITDLSVRVAGKDILKGVNLEVHAGEIHAIVGRTVPARAHLRRCWRAAGYEITGGSVTYEGRDLWPCPPKSARAGLFLGFQYPVEIPGVNNVYLLKAALNAKRKAAGEPEVDAYEFLTLIRQKMKVMHMSETFLTRGVNEGFSGGEKKRNEILQMLVLEPKLAILDETDSGLDIDALKVVSAGVNSLNNPAARHRAGDSLPAIARLILCPTGFMFVGRATMKSGDDRSRKSSSAELRWVLESQVA